MKSTAKEGKQRLSLQRAKVKLLASYYGHPARDLKIICITGSTGKVAVAHLVHEILTAANQPSAILASENAIKATILHKFLNDAWKAKVTYVVITAAPDALAAETFHGLPIHVAALTDFVPSGLTDTDLQHYLDAEGTLFRTNPDIVVLNRDDAHYPEFAKFQGKEETMTYGASSDSDLRIDRSKLYKKGVEASLAVTNRYFTVASFLTGEPAVSYMACAAAIASALKIAPDTIIDGIANYNPEQ